MDTLISSCRRFRGLAGLAALALGGCAHTLEDEAALTSLPYDLRDNGRIVIEARLNDSGPFAFALDTGASISFVSDALRAQLALAARPGISAEVHGLVASGRFPLVRADRIAIGTEIWDDADLVSIPAATPATARLDGILGIDFLRRYAVRFSPQDRAVHLYAPADVSRSAYRGWASVPLEPRIIGESSEPLYFLDARIGEQIVPALFDLGAGLNMLNPAGADYFRLSASSGRRRPVVSGGLDTAAVLARLAAEPLETGAARWRGEVFLIGDLEIFATLDYTDRPLAILGSGLFNQREFVIDFARRRLLIRTEMAEIETVP